MQKSSQQAPAVTANGKISLSEANLIKKKKRNKIKLAITAKNNSVPRMSKQRGNKYHYGEEGQNWVIDKFSPRMKPKQHAIAVNLNAYLRDVPDGAYNNVYTDLLKQSRLKEQAVYLVETDNNGVLQVVATEQPIEVPIPAKAPATTYQQPSRRMKERTDNYFNIDLPTDKTDG
jgi:hypothetical protein